MLNAICISNLVWKSQQIAECVWYYYLKALLLCIFLVLLEWFTKIIIVTEDAYCSPWKYTLWIYQTGHFDLKTWIWETGVCNSEGCSINSIPTEQQLACNAQDFIPVNQNVKPKNVKITGLICIIFCALHCGS